ncbi:MAG: DUF2357 domain-containing protein, partial [Fibrobacter sp.]|nr:DUF2357 domain-containing protein [Fibrobacter sp.]
YGNYFPHIANQENKWVKCSKDGDRFSFQFINYLGKSQIVFGSSEKQFSFEIVPLKIDYEEDYVKLTDDIAEKCSALLLDFSSPTNLNFKHDYNKTQKSPLEMFIFIRKFCSSSNIEYLLQCIKNNPDCILVSEDELKPFGLRPISQKFFSNPFGNSKNWMCLENGSYLPELISSTRKYTSLDTPANRFLKFAFNAFIDVCEKVLNQIKGEYSYKQEAKSLEQSLHNVLDDSFFDDVGELVSIPVNNQVLQKREGYAQVFNAFNMLDLAMQLDWKGQEKVYEGEARNIALLYEYYLVFFLMDVIKNLGAEFELDKIEECDAKQMLSNKDKDGLLVSIKEGETSLLSVILKEKELRINFYYNKTFKKNEFNGTKYQGSYSRDFRPDYTFAFFSSRYSEEKDAIQEGEVSYLHFDAKYRVTDITSLFGKEPSINGDDENDSFNQEKREETVNTYNRGDLLKMHTYNDAIRRTIGSYVLYPGSSNDNKNKFQVFDELLPGVGAFAIRPGDTKRDGEKTLIEFIRDVIEFKCKTSSRQYRKDYFENMVIRNASDKSLFVEKVDHNQARKPVESKLIMIGFVREEYYKYLEDKNIVPKGNNYKNYIGNEFYFYFHAIKAGHVYTLHKETTKSKYLRLTDIAYAENFSEKTIENLKKWNAEIISIELVSKQELQKILDKYPSKDEFLADFYYLVKAKIINLDLNKIKISNVDADENQAISPYSPKIVQLEV